MRRASLLVLMLMLAPLSAYAAVAPLQCSACRSPDTHPKDFGNYAFNQVFGAKPTASYQDNARFKVTNGKGRWAVVDLDFILEETGITALIGFFSVEIPAIPVAVLISIYTDAGDYVTTRAVPVSADLRVGDQETSAESPSIPSTSGGSGGGGGSTGGYTTVPTTYRYHFNDGSSGTVSICNPDIRGDCRSR